MKYLLTLLLLCACGHVPTSDEIDPDVACFTSHGMRVLKPVPAGWCEAVDAAEDRIVAVFVQWVTPYDHRFAAAGDLIAGWDIHVQPDRAWTLPLTHSALHVSSVMGVTYCSTFEVYVGNDMPGAGALGHELAHVVQNCTPMPPFASEDKTSQEYYHSNWGPIESALNVR